MRLAVATALVLAFAGVARAETPRRLDLDFATWRATHVVIARAGEDSFGVCKVLESVRGDSKPGETITVPGLETFAKASERAITGKRARRGVTHVSGERLFVFLRKTETGWTASTGCIETSVAWIEKGEVYGHDNGLVPLETREEELRLEVERILRMHDALREAARTADAEALATFLGSQLYIAQLEARDELEKCGKAALPVIRARLARASLVEDHPALVDLLAAIGGKEVETELTEIVRKEDAYWRRIGPTPWEGCCAAERTYLEARQSKRLRALVALEELERRR